MLAGNLKKAMAMTMLAVIVSACAGGPSTAIVRAERLTDIPAEPYQNVLVVGVARDQSSARRFENILAERIIESGTIATAGSAAGIDGDITATTVRDAARRLQADAVIVTSVKQADIEAKVDEGQAVLRPDRKEGNLANFFRYDYKEITAPVSIATSYDVLLETDVYDTATGTKVYTLESRTIEAEAPFEIVMQESSAIAGQLRKDSIIK